MLGAFQRNNVAVEDAVKPNDNSRTCKKRILYLVKGLRKRDSNHVGNGRLVTAIVASSQMNCGTSLSVALTYQMRLRNEDNNNQSTGSTEPMICCIFFTIS